jgi:hypothetical protein
MSHPDEFQYYAAYGGLGRVALMWGVPLLPFLMLFFLAIFGFVVGFFLFGFLYGLLSASVFGGAMFFMKVLCENDDRAVERWKWKARGLVHFIRARKMIVMVGVDIANQDTREKNVYQFFKENRA